MELISLRNRNVAMLGWDDIEDAVRLVAVQLREARFSPSIVIGIERGGCIPAVWLSHLLDVGRFSSISVRTTVSDDIRAERLQLPALPGALRDYSADRVLIVDDVTNTGVTLRAARDALLASGCLDLRTAALFRDTVGADDMFEVDFIGPSVHAWVLFPWER
jgi:hypoxanthine phosphoribosyltransferase